jgi:hypothetical protein
MRKYYVIQVDGEQPQKNLEEILQGTGYSFIAHPSTPVELASDAPGQVLWHNGKVVVRGDMSKMSEARIYLHPVIEGVERLPRGYMLGGNACTLNLQQYQPKSK